MHSLQANNNTNTIVYPQYMLVPTNVNTAQSDNNMNLLIMVPKRTAPNINTTNTLEENTGIKDITISTQNQPYYDTTIIIRNNIGNNNNNNNNTLNLDDTRDTTILQQLKSLKHKESNKISKSSYVTQDNTKDDSIMIDYNINDSTYLQDDTNIQNISICNTNQITIQKSNILNKDIKSKVLFTTDINNNTITSNHLQGDTKIRCNNNNINQDTINNQNSSEKNIKTIKSSHFTDITIHIGFTIQQLIQLIHQLQQFYINTIQYYTIYYQLIQDIYNIPLVLFDNALTNLQNIQDFDEETVKFIYGCLPSPLPLYTESSINNTNYKTVFDLLYTENTTANNNTNEKNRKRRRYSNTTTTTTTTAKLPLTVNNNNNKSNILTKVLQSLSIEEKKLFIQNIYQIFVPHIQINMSNLVGQYLLDSIEKKIQIHKKDDINSNTNTTTNENTKSMYESISSIHSTVNYLKNLYNCIKLLYCKTITTYNTLITQNLIPYEEDILNIHLELKEQLNNINVLLNNFTTMITQSTEIEQNIYTSKKCDDKRFPILTGAIHEHLLKIEKRLKVLLEKKFIRDTVHITTIVQPKNDGFESVV